MTTLAFPRFSIKTILRGGSYGSLAGFIASELFLIGLVVLALATEFWQQRSVSTGLLGVFLLGHIYGVLPSLVIGFVSGCIIGIVFALFPTAGSNPNQGGAMGAASAFVLFAGTVIAFYVRDGSPAIQYTADTVPSIAISLIIALFYIASGAWVGKKLASVRPL